MKKLRAFTLIEMIIVIAILAVLSVMVAPVLQSGFTAYNTSRDLNDASWQGSLALARMSRDITDLPSATGISVASSTQFTFVDRNNTSVSYTLSGNNLLRNTQVLASGVNSVSFAYYDSTGAVTATIANIRYLTINLNITKNNTDLTLFTTINLRNVL